MTEFSELGLSPTTLQAVADTGYTTATPIQAAAIPVALAGQDVLGIAQTGTGKTAAFTLPMIDKLASGRAKARMPRALVIAPTRELADQVASSFEKYAKGTKLSWALLIGGVSFGDQVKKLDRGVDVLIATPGRLLDHFERGGLLMTGVQIMVVDEADRMLDMGFIPDIERIFKMTPPKKQTLFFSATMPPEITRLTKQFLRDPVRIEASRPATTNENITQLMVKVPSSDPKAKRLALRALIEKAQIETGIVFCNRKTEVDVVAKSLKSHGFDAAAIHGDLDQSQRMKTLAAFRDGSLKILVASDVAARGLDIPAVSHVFNYDVPHHADDYVHRIGRTGRAGRSGITYMLVTPADDKGFDKVVKLIGSTPQEEKLDLDYSGAVTVRREGDKRGGGRDRAPRGGERGRDRDRNRAPTEPSDVAAANFEAAISGVPAPPVAATVTGDEPAKRPARVRKPRGEKAGAVVADTVEAEAPVATAAPVAPIAEKGRRDRGGSSRDRGRQPRVEDAADAQPQVEAERAPRPERAEGERPSRERGRERGRDRDRRPERSEQPRVEAEQPRVEAERAPRPERIEGERPSRERGRGRDRDRRPERSEQPRVEAERAPAPRDQPERAPVRGAPLPVRGVQPIRGREDDDDRRVVGFGNETPAFLMRAPPRLAPASDTED
ncbi:DEAD/DEAH box helicase [Caulobacter sp. Root655]|uniref:DEAD/DEAH box helicase n=1 Tax=Caulobacter sp. Root655 TaxID=1736578 RepID=UPI0006F6B4C5|nr:DEAD/DEAH box helicase [Caulobacter sp. Root655]KRA60046.1 DEAD/DEAH box helicase [Caulobacter sp. Root655]